LRYLPALLIGRLVRFAVRLVRPGGGSALPGLVISKLAPNLVYRTLNSFSQGLVVVTGTAGKSTTTKMLVAIARSHGLNVFTNPSTANIEQGFLSTIIRQANIFGRVNGDIAILEMDEGHAAQIVEKVKPKTSIILNVFEDQLDRFVDPALVRDKLSQVAKATYGKVILNADDQNCLIIKNESNAESIFFGLGDSLLRTAGASMTYAPVYQNEIKKPAVEHEASSLEGRNLTASISGKKIQFELPSRGVHFALDAVASLAGAKEILGQGFNLDLAVKVLNELPPVFSRGEVREVNGEPCEFILVQNPVSMQLNIDNLSAAQEQVFFAIGRDVHDPSWMWTVDLTSLDNVHTVSGFNYADAALLLAYNEVLVTKVEADYFKAIDEFFALPKPEYGMKTVVYSADAMRRLRRYLGFTDPEDVDRV
jgi:UDP-N-acetylmuramyl pentapeptide synthase